jgi:ribonucleotide reductase beta subunit family protein with ferritin-like domain
MGTFNKTIFRGVMIKKAKSNLMDERQSFKPFHYPWAYEAWLKHEQIHWLHTEVPMLEDVKDWKNRLTASEKQFLTHIFRFFTQGDIDVAGGYVKNYLPYFRQPEVRMMLLGFAAREALHIAAYSHLIETLGLPDTMYNQFLEYDELFTEIMDYIFDNLGDLVNKLEIIIIPSISDVNHLYPLPQPPPLHILISQSKTLEYEIYIEG